MTEEADKKKQKPKGVYKDKYFEILWKDFFADMTKEEQDEVFTKTFQRVRKVNPPNYLLSTPQKVTGHTSDDLLNLVDEIVRLR